MVPSVLGDELLWQLRKECLAGLTGTVCAISDTAGLLVLEIFLPGLTNWVTGFGRLGRFVDCAKVTLRRQLGYWDGETRQTVNL